MVAKGGSVYILTNLHNTTLHTGVSSDLYGRVLEHKEKIYSKSFTARYNINKLVYFEHFGSIEEAIHREKQIKAAFRKYKEGLINSINPDWRDLFNKLE
jgi:putative endonuclease